jgi:hypothetical protein
LLMADFFTRTAERALQLVPVVGPDLTPLLAPSARTELVQPARDFAAGEPANISLSLNQMAQPRGRARAVAQEERSYERTEGEDESSKLSIQHEIGQIRGERRAAVGVNRSGFETMADNGRIPFEPRESDLDGIPSEAPNAGRGRVIRPTQAAMPGEKILAFERSAASVPPAIHVSIGRVEVRAITPPSPRITVRERKAAQRLSLEQYLSERNEGRR